MWSLGWIGGPVVDTFGRRETAYVHREMLTMLRATPVWAIDAPKSVRDGLIAWTNQMIGLIAPYTPARELPELPQPRHRRLEAASTTPRTIRGW